MKGILRKILCGDVWPNNGRSYVHDEVTARCACGCPAEDLVHLWWKCPRWEHLRNPVLSALDLGEFPRGLMTNGLALDELSANWVADVQRMYVAIYKARFLEGCETGEINQAEVDVDSSESSDEDFPS